MAYVSFDAAPGRIIRDEEWTTIYVGRSGGRGTAIVWTRVR